MPLAISRVACKYPASYVDLLRVRCPTHGQPVVDVKIEVKKPRWFCASGAFVSVRSLRVLIEFAWRACRFSPPIAACLLQAAY